MRRPWAERRNSPTTTICPTKVMGLFTTEAASIGQERTIEGRIAPSPYGNFAVLNASYLTVPEEQK